MTAAVPASKIKRNREYDPFARLYNKHWGADYWAEAFPITEHLLLSRLKPGASVLDVCCGTGQFTARVRERGFRVAGIDASSAMIRYARRNAPGLDLTVADVRDFSLGRTFDGAYSVYESLNHVADIAGLELAFVCIRRHLKPGAPFLFDLNREEAYILYWNNTDAIVENGYAFITRSVFDEETRSGRCDVTIFDEGKAGSWSREDFTLTQTCHPMADVHTALRNTGFRNISLHDARDAGMAGDAGYARTFFLATA
jgi:SAM-dependent methyltransferase